MGLKNDGSRDGYLAFQLLPSLAGGHCGQRTYWAFDRHRSSWHYGWPWRRGAALGLGPPGNSASPSPPKWSEQ